MRLVNYYFYKRGNDIDRTTMTMYEYCQDGRWFNKKPAIRHGKWRKKIDFVCARHKKYPVHVQKRQKLVGDVA